MTLPNAGTWDYVLADHTRSYKLVAVCPRCLRSFRATWPKQDPLSFKDFITLGCKHCGQKENYSHVTTR